MTTPSTLPFDIIAARDWNWPLVTRDGDNAKFLGERRHGKFPLIALMLDTEDQQVQEYTLGGGFYGDEGESTQDLLLSANFSDPKVRAAVEAAHRAGEDISYQCPTENFWTIARTPRWAWGDVRYFPTRFVDLLPKPAWTPPPLPDGWEAFTPKVGEKVGEKVNALWVAKNAPPDSNSGRWTDCEDFEIQSRDLSENGFLFARRKWTLPSAPVGQSWHREDWSADMLPPVTDGGLPWRPLLSDEAAVKGVDDIYMSGGWEKCDSDFKPGDFIRISKFRWFRTRRPLPKPAEPWSKPEHVPGPVCWIANNTMRNGGYGGALVVCVSGDGIQFCGTDNRIHFLTWDDLKDPNKAYSTTRAPGSWLPCTVN